KTAGLYNKLGIFSYEDLLYYFPRDYIKYEAVTNITDVNVGDLVSLKARIVKQPLLKKVKRFQIVSAYLKTDEAVISATWFNMGYLVKSLKPGEVYIFRGIISTKGESYHIEQPQIFSIDKYEEILDTLQPVYSLTKGISNQSITKAVRNLFNDSHFPEMNLKSTVDDYGKIRDALETIHFPKDMDSLIEARKLLVFDEFFTFILKLRLLKEENERLKNSFNIVQSAYTRRLIESLPYKLTNAQMKVFEEIESDLLKPYSMSRLVQGDVGSGKTIISILAAITVAASGYQTALMAPTEILASQHFQSITELFKKYNIPFKCCLLTGSMTAARKREVYSQIESGEVQIIIGTHALIQKKVNYNNLALVITDEQHRFGVRQREALSSKNESDNPHILVMSATPIPRTLAIIMYGDLDISVIDEVPARRLPIKNCVVGTDYRNTAYKFILKEIDAGSQAYIICPLVEESEGLEAEDVISYTDKLKGVFPERVNISYLHGKMKQDEKNRIMDAFYRNDIQILVSTTVVEVGVNVPNATVMLVENAERFGLAQLHQLRGRIGRGDKQSYCIFMSQKNNEANIKRLEILNKSNDGFYIASEDMKLRGPGDLFGLRQSGDMHFKLADVFNDATILKEASDKVDELLKSDKDLSKPENSRIKDMIEESIRRDLTTTL
ncbi:MAG: ATP-dependent DNA helicase RecG, partial [Lachnospiraceae bacterium]|nr:ATP-dependent DNA helicase RecG [Lachnospiraceae bacterium]